MLAKISDVKSGIVWDGHRYRIYIIEADGICLYVGKSKEALTRMESHVGKGEWSGFFGSSIDLVLCQSGADNYAVLFMSEADIDEYIRQLDVASYKTGL